MSNRVETKTVKVLINACFGGFSLSPEALLWLYKHGYKEKGFKLSLTRYFGKDYKKKKDSVIGYYNAIKKWNEYLKTGHSGLFIATFTPDKKFILSGAREIKRDNKILLECFKILGSKKMSGSCAKLAICEIPFDVDWVIEEYDGYESVEETHRSWHAKNE